MECKKILGKNNKPIQCPRPTFPACGICELNKKVRLREGYKRGIDVLNHEISETLKNMIREEETYVAEVATTKE